MEPAAVVDQAVVNEVAENPLARVVERQRQENDGLRAALRHRAVIEQAKGVLMARAGVDPETAFQHLVAHSQRTNLKVAQVAAAVVARSIAEGPVAPPTGLTDGQILDDATSGGAHRWLVAAAVAAAPDFTELIETVVEHTGRLGVQAGTLTLAEPDGALRLVAWHGVESYAASGWQRIPPGADLPVCAAAETRTPVWLKDSDERRHRFPGSERFPAHRNGSAVFPLVDDRQLVGCLGLEWDGPCDLAEADRIHLAQVAHLCAAPVAALLRRHDDALPELDLEPAYSRWFRAFLDSVPVPTLLLEPEVVDGRLVDLTIVFVNRAAGRCGPLRAGTSMLEIRPDLVPDDALTQALAVLRTGIPLRVPEVTLRDANNGLRVEFQDVNVVRVGSLLSLSWRD